MSVYPQKIVGEQVAPHRRLWVNNLSKVTSQSAGVDSNLPLSGYKTTIKSELIMRSKNLMSLVYLFF